MPGPGRGRENIKRKAGMNGFQPWLQGRYIPASETGDEGGSSGRRLGHWLSHVDTRSGCQSRAAFDLDDWFDAMGTKLGTIPIQNHRAL